MPNSMTPSEKPIEKLSDNQIDKLLEDIKASLIKYRTQFSKERVQQVLSDGDAMHLLRHSFLQSLNELSGTRMIKTCELEVPLVHARFRINYSVSLFLADKLVEKFGAGTKLVSAKEIKTEGGDPFPENARVEVRYQEPA